MNRDGVRDEPDRSADEDGTGARPGPTRAERVRRRVGRDLVAAFGIGILFGAVLLALLYLVKPAFLVLVVAFGVIGVWEVGRALTARSVSVTLPPLYAMVAGAAVTGYLFGLTGVVLTAAFGTLFVLFWRMRAGVDGYVRDATAGVALAMYVPVLLSFMALLLRPADGGDRVLVFIASVFASDTGGLALGVLAGRHPLAAAISPKKSWEGLVGSLVLAAAVGGWLVWWLLESAWWYGVLVGVTAAVVGTAGDLAESMIKRDLGIKDMSSLLPGHGGVMDRLDSLVAAAPAVWALLTLFVPPGTG